MQVSKLLAVTGVLVLIVIAPEAAVAKAGGSDRPLHGSGTTSDTADLATGVGSGEGPAIVSHLGKGTFKHEFTTTFTSATTLEVTSDETYTAANGDQLFATFTASGTLTGLTAVVTGTGTITGGTGRFDDASGTLSGVFRTEIISVVGTTLISTTTFDIRGRISY